MLLLKLKKIKMLSNILLKLLDLAKDLIGPLAFFFIGRKSKELKDVKEQNEVLQDQRDNDIHSLDDADDFWMRFKDK